MSDEVTIPDGFLSEWCRTMSTGTESPPAAYLATGLVTVASIVGPRIYARWSPTRKERCNLWILNVGRSALARKTTGMSAARWGVDVARAKLGDQIRWYGPKRLSDAQMAVDLDVAGADTKEAQREENEIAREEKREPRELSPIQREIPVSWLIGFNELAPLWGEGLRDWQQATQAFLLDIFDGELASSTRASNVTEQETFVCALGNIPPAELAARTTLGMLTSGFAGRWVILPSPGPVEPISRPMMNGGDPLMLMTSRVHHLAEMASTCRGLDVNEMWREGGLAAKARDDWYRRWWTQLMRADANSLEIAARADLFGRLQASALKLATIAAVCRWAHELDALDQVRVGEEDALWAQDVVDASIRSMMEVVDDAGGGSTSILGKIEHRILNFLRKRKAVDEESAVNFSDLGDSVKQKDSRREVAMALESLVNMEKVVIADTRSGPRGGRPARVVWMAD